MLFSTATRSLLLSNARRLNCATSNNNNAARYMSSVASPSSNDKPGTNRQRNIHSDAPNQIHGTKLNYVAASPTYEPESDAAPAESSSPMAERFKVTAEVTVSKIFPAGFAWQSSSIVAEEVLGYAPDSLGFALTTGAGDALGVFAGHCAYFLVKKQVTDKDGSDGNPSIDMEQEVQTGALLGTAAFFSGTAWQPLVNALQGLELPFYQVFAGTWIGCGTAFYFGLRTARTVLSGPLKHVHYPTFENSRTDKSLSLAIGGATGFFVGTDTAYLPAENFLIGAVGIHDSMSAAAGTVVAGECF